MFKNNFVHQKFMKTTVFQFDIIRKPFKLYTLDFLKYKKNNIFKDSRTNLKIIEFTLVPLVT